MKKMLICMVLFLGILLVSCSMQTPAVEKEPQSKEEANRLLRELQEEAQAQRLQQEKEAREANLREWLSTKKQAEAELRRQAEERKAEEARIAEEQRRKEEAEKKAEEEKRRAEEQARQAELKRQGIVEGPLGILMGEFTTSYADSSQARKHNIQHAASMINGTKLAAGESFSTAATIQPITEANGYKTAGAYQDGKVIDSVGGGVCQISTTLYNAVLEAELKVTERAEHSMTVSYVKVARDAAIAGDYKDLCFINDSGDTIHIEAQATDSELTFRIWGKDTKKKNGRTIDFETVILERYEPGEPVITEDESKAADYYHETQSAHTGYKAELYKVVYQDGVEKNRIKINSSSYEASPAYVVVGTQ